MNMKKELSTWNGYTVHGDAMELDTIVESTGFIKLDKDDIIGVLSADGENWIATGNDFSMDSALSIAINNLPFSIDKVNNLLIDFRYGNIPPKMANISMITATMSDANPDIEVGWSISSDESLENTFKVIIVASADI